MNKKLVALLLSGVLTLSLIGCGNSSDQDSTKPVDNDTTVEESQSDNDSESSQVDNEEVEKIEDKAIEEAFNNINKNNTEELVDFINSNIDQSTEKLADKMIVQLIQTVQDKEVKDINDYLYSESMNDHGKISKQVHAAVAKAFPEQGYSAILGDSKAAVVEALENETLKEKIGHSFTYYVGFYSAEGTYYGVIDYAHIASDYLEFLSAPMKEYVSLVAAETKKPSLNEEYLAISVQEMADRAVAYEVFLKENPSFELKEDLQMYLNGLLWKIASPNYFEGTLTQEFMFPKESYTVYQELAKQDKAPVVQYSASKVLEYVDSKDGEPLGSMENMDAMYEVSYDINNKAKAMLNELYINPIAKEDKTALLENSKKILSALKDKKHDVIASYIGSESLLMAPYTYVDEDENVQFSKDEYLAADKENTKYVWGVTDGKGDTIELSINEFYEKYIYSNDYLTKNPEILINQKVQRGNSINNVFEEYPEAYVVEYYLNGTNEYANMDWSSIKLVFKKVNDQFELVALINSQWTI